MGWVDYIVVAAAGYLLGSIPFAVIIARMVRRRYFQGRRGNPGATNVKRSCGKTAATCALFSTPQRASPRLRSRCTRLLRHGVFRAADACVRRTCVGDNRPLVLGIRKIQGRQRRGGHNRRASRNNVGGDFYRACVVGCRVLFDALCFACVNRNGVGVPVAAAFLYPFPGAQVYIATAIAVVIVVRHRSNIARLIKGTENRF